MSERDQFNRFVERHPHRAFFQRPHWTRRQFFHLLGAGVTGSYLARRAPAAEIVLQGSVTTRNTAKNVIFILLAGAPSHTDTFDLKMVDGVTPANFNPTNVNGVLWPVGLLPKLGEQLQNIAIVRSMRSWALAHALGQHWTQIGRNPSAALGDIAPNIGSIVAIEKDVERQQGQIFPPFLALNSNGAIGGGYLPATYSPFKVTPAITGIPNIRNVDGAARMETRWSLLHKLDDPLRVDSPLGDAADDFSKFDGQAYSLMNDPQVDRAFAYTTQDAARYGNSAFGNACLVAKQVLGANQGTRFVQITLGGWDMHTNIYGTANIRAGNLYTQGKMLDDGLAALLADLK